MKIRLELHDNINDPAAPSLVAIENLTRREFEAIKYGLQELSQSGRDDALTRNADRMFKLINKIKFPNND